MCSWTQGESIKNMFLLLHMYCGTSVAIATKIEIGTTVVLHAGKTMQQ